jgi:sec-independent protein translocase protein TatA
MPAGIGLPEILIVAAVVVLLFGARKLPEVARSLGRARSEFRKGLEESTSEEEKAKAEEPRKAETTE